MKQVWRKLLCVMLALTMLFLTAEPTSAATKEVYKYSYSILEEGEVVSGRNTETYNSAISAYVYKSHIYKITIPSDGYITVTNVYAKSEELYLFRTKEDAKALDGNDYDACGYVDEGCKSMIPLAKGSYYIRACSYRDYKFKYTFTKATVPVTNLCRAKATTLKPEVKKTICVPRGYQGLRWYKINLSTSKVISITFKDLTGSMSTEYPDIRLTDTKGKEIDIVYKSGAIYKSAKKLPAGSYYLVVGNNDSEIYNELYWSYLYTLSWK